LLWLVYPDFRVSNPYQDLLARALSDCGLNTRFGTITDALEATQSSPTVFHLHWEDTIYATASSENDARESVEAFLVELAVFREIGGLVVWTLHNAAPHEDAFPILSPPRCSAWAVTIAPACRPMFFGSAERRFSVPA
jgi:hypothetical protein